MTSDFPGVSTTTGPLVDNRGVMSFYDLGEQVPLPWMDVLERYPNGGRFQLQFPTLAFLEFFLDIPSGNLTWHWKVHINLKMYIFLETVWEFPLLCWLEANP